MTQRHDTALDYRARIVRVLRLLQEAAAAGAPTPPVEDLAREAHFSRFHFSRVFNAMVGESVAAHTRRLRLERAAGELAHTERQVLNIALACGFEAQESFARAFKAHVGCTPTEFREANAGRDCELPPAPNHVRFGVDDVVSRFVPLIKENPMLEVKVETTPDRRLAVMEHVGPYHELGPVFQRLMGWAFQSGMMGPMSEALAIYHDDPGTTEPERLRSHACVTAPPGFEGDPGAGVGAMKLPGGAYAVGVFKGPYERLDEAWQWLYGTWLPGSGHQPDERPCFEIYLNNPMQVAPEDCLTAIHIPIVA